MVGQRVASRERESSGSESSKKSVGQRVASRERESGGAESS